MCLVVYYGKDYRLGRCNCSLVKFAFKEHVLATCPLGVDTLVVDLVERWHESCTIGMGTDSVPSPVR